MGRHDDAVWYVAYGSNLDAARFHRYLERHRRRGRSVRPLADQPSRLPHRLFFAHESRVWTGGTAFIDPAVGSGDTLARAWLVRRDQFLSVLSQENGDAAVEWDDAWWELGPGAVADATSRRYGRVIGCASPDHRPALTFTTPAEPLPARNTPSRAYVDVIVAGLVVVHDLHPAEAARYVDDRC